MNRVSQFIQSPTTIYWTTVKRIIRYLKGSTSHGITLKPTSSLSLNAYSDANWAGSIDDCESTSEFFVFFLVTALFHRVLRSNQLSPDQAPKPNTNPLLLLVLSSFGYNTSWLNFTFLSRLHPFYGVIILERPS